MVFARLFFDKMKLSDGAQIEIEPNKFFDQRTIAIYDYVIQNHVEVKLRNGNWAQEFYRLDEMMTYITTQFSDLDFVQNILNGKPINDGQ